MYTDPKWSDPYDANGDLTLTGSTVQVDEVEMDVLSVFPNPAHSTLNIRGASNVLRAQLYDAQGRLALEGDIGSKVLSVEGLSAGVYSLLVHRVNAHVIAARVIIE